MIGGWVDIFTSILQASSFQWFLLSAFGSMFGHLWDLLWDLNLKISGWSLEPVAIAGKSQLYFPRGVARMGLLKFGSPDNHAQAFEPFVTWHVTFASGIFGRVRNLERPAKSHVYEPLHAQVHPSDKLLARSIPKAEGLSLLGPLSPKHLTGARRDGRRSSKP